MGKVGSEDQEKLKVRFIFTAILIICMYIDCSFAQGPWASFVCVSEHPQLLIIFPELGCTVLHRQNPVGVDELLVTTFRASRNCFVGFFRAVSFTDNLNVGATPTAPSGDRCHDRHRFRLCPARIMQTEKETATVHAGRFFLLSGSSLA
jgi:hypothetical protein